MVPGSISNEAKEIFQEGLRLPAIKLIAAGNADPLGDRDHEGATAGCPISSKGDMWAGIAAARVGERRILELIAKYGARDVHGRAAHRSWTTASGSR